nr:MAG TPA: hypothetical protein [Caudoviricetes sp.]
MFTINQGFDLNSPQFNFKRDYFANVADLKAAPETSFPDHFITNVAGVLYQLTKSNSVDATTGKWRKVQLGSDVDLSDYATKNEAIVSSTIESDNNSVSIFFKKGDDLQLNYDIPNASHSSAGVITANDKAKLDGIAVGANNYTLPTATTAALGGIKTNYTNNGKNYKVDVDTNGNAYVNVPWTDTKTDISNCITLADNTQTFNGSKKLRLNNDNGLEIQTFNTGSTSQFNFTKYGFDINTGFSTNLRLLGSGIASVSKTTGTIVGLADKLFATNGSIFDASKLATTAALNSILANYVKSTTLTTTLENYAKTSDLQATNGAIATLTNSLNKYVPISLTDGNGESSTTVINRVRGGKARGIFESSAGFGLYSKGVTTLDQTDEGSGCAAVELNNDAVKIRANAGISIRHDETATHTSGRIDISPTGVISIASQGAPNNEFFATNGHRTIITAISTEKLNEIFV